jgi:hypothetical protein
MFFGSSSPQLVVDHQVKIRLFRMNNDYAEGNRRVANLRTAQQEFLPLGRSGERIAMGAARG